MREIKFRAWDKRTNCFRGEILSKYERLAILNSNDFEIMQYTGLKDKNGVEIYAKDKLHNPNDREPYYIIDWNEIEGCWELGKDGYPIGKYRLEEFWEVIGNIWEKK